MCCQLGKYSCSILQILHNRLALFSSLYARGIQYKHRFLYHIVNKDEYCTKSIHTDTPKEQAVMQKEIFLIGIFVIDPAKLITKQSQYYVNGTFDV